MAYLNEPVSQSSTLSVLHVDNVKCRKAPKPSKTNAIEDFFQHPCCINTVGEFRIRCQGAQQLMSRLESHCILAGYENVVEDGNDRAAAVFVQRMTAESYQGTLTDAILRSAVSLPLYSAIARFGSGRRPPGIENRRCQSKHSIKVLYLSSL